MPTTREIICPKCGALAGTSSVFLSLSKPYCSVCGWNLERAKEGERRNLKQLPFTLLWVAIVFGSVIYFSAAKHSSPGILPFFVIGLVEIGAFTSWRRLKVMGDLRPSRGFPDASRPVTPNQSPSAVDVKTRILYDRLLVLSRPRRISLKLSTRLLLVAFICFVSVAVSVLILDHTKTNPNPNSANTVTNISFFMIFALIFISMAGGTVRSVFRDRKLLANGDIAIGVVVDQETIGGKSKTSKIKYDFKDAAGRTYTGKSNDGTRELYEDMSTVVFYDRDNPAKNVPLAGSTVDLVDF
jgi:hypothetical protein